MRRNAVALVADEALFPAAAFLASRLAHLNPRDDTDIILFSNWDEGLAAARAMELPAVLRTADFAALDFGRVQPTAALPAAAYFRVGLPALLAADYARIVYLDIDIYPLSDRLFGLFNIDLGNYPVAAIRPLGATFGASSSGYRTSHGWPPGAKYLSTGVLLIDTDAYQGADIEGRVWATIHKLTETPYFGDQTVLNLVLAGAWRELSPSYNMNIPYAFTEIGKAFPPVLLHFPGSIKPWSAEFPLPTHPARTELAAFLSGTPWERFLTPRPPEATLRRRWRTFLRRLRHPARHGPTSPRYPPRRLAETDLDLPGLLRYLTTTEFADVTAGLTRPRLRHLPRA